MELSRLEGHPAPPVHSPPPGHEQQQQQQRQQQQQHPQQHQQQQQEQQHSQGSGDLPHRNPGGRPPGWFRREHFLEPTTSEGRKNNRVQLTCKYCAAQIVSRSELLSEHCTSRCQQIPPDIRAQCVQQLVARQAAVKRPAPKPVLAKKPKQDRVSGESSRGRLADPQQYELNAKLLRVFAAADIAFAHADSPVLQDLLVSLNPDFRPTSMPSALFLYALCLNYASQVVDMTDAQLYISILGLAIETACTRQTSQHFVSAPGLPHCSCQAHWDPCKGSKSPLAPGCACLECTA